MAKKTAAVILVVGILGVILTLGAFDKNIVTTGCDGDVLWNADVAYLFIGCGDLGHRISYLSYPFEDLREHLGAIRPADDRRAWTIVIRIDKSSVTRYGPDQSRFDFYTPFDGEIFANHEGTLWRWAGTGFVKANYADKDRAARLNALNFDNVNGWSKRTEILSQLDGETTFQLQLDGIQPSLIVNRKNQGRNITIDLVRPNQVPEQLWHLDRQPRSVTRAEYNEIFRKN